MFLYYRCPYTLSNNVIKKMIFCSQYAKGDARYMALDVIKFISSRMMYSFRKHKA